MDQARRVSCRWDRGGRGLGGSVLNIKPEEIEDTTAFGVRLSTEHILGMAKIGKGREAAAGHRPGARGGRALGHARCGLKRTG